MWKGCARVLLSLGTAREQKRPAHTHHFDQPDSRSFPTGTDVARQKKGGPCTTEKISDSTLRLLVLLSAPLTRARGPATPSQPQPSVEAPISKTRQPEHMKSRACVQRDVDGAASTTHPYASAVSHFNSGGSHITRLARSLPRFGFATPPFLARSRPPPS